MGDRITGVSFKELAELAGHVVIFDALRQLYAARRILIEPIEYLRGQWTIVADCDEMLAAARVHDRLALTTADRSSWTGCLRSPR